MLERFERPLKIVCLGLAALLIFQVASVIFRGDPLASVKIPELPSLPGGTNETDKVAKQGTNAPDSKKGATNGTNALISGSATNKTNLTVSGSGSTTNRTNNAAANATNASSSFTKGTNEAGSTNTVKHTDLTKGTNAANGPARTNATSAVDGKTNSAKPHPGGPPGAPGDMMAQMMGGGMPGFPGMPGRPGGRRGGGAKPVTLPAETQARVDRIIESEILGPTARPVPMALVGISDDEAFIRATNGQTGPIKIGGEMAGIKLLRIALNRVLVEQDGEKKELTLFGGVGSESLMPKAPDSPSTNSPAASSSSTNAPSTNSPAKRHTPRAAAAKDASTNLSHSSEQKEAP